MSKKIGYFRAILYALVGFGILTNLAGFASGQSHDFGIAIERVTDGDAIVSWQTKRGYLYELENSYDLTEWETIESFYGMGQVIEVPLEVPISGSGNQGGAGTPAGFIRAEHFVLYAFDNGSTLVSFNHGLTTPVTVLIPQDFTPAKVVPFFVASIPGDEPDTTFSLTLMNGAIPWSPYFTQSSYSPSQLTEAQLEQLSRITNHRNELILAAQSFLTGGNESSQSGAPAQLGVTASLRAVELSIDSDSDGLSDATELEIGTNPFSADTDGDGTDDAIELRDGRDPTKSPDLDANGNPIFGTDQLSLPSDKDFDHDGYLNCTDFDPIDPMIRANRTLAPLLVPFTVPNTGSGDWNGIAVNNHGMVVLARSDDNFPRFWKPGDTDLSILKKDNDSLPIMKDDPEVPTIALKMVSATASDLNDTGIIVGEGKYTRVPTPVYSGAVSPVVRTAIQWASADESATALHPGTKPYQHPGNSGDAELPSTAISIDNEGCVIGRSAALDTLDNVRPDIPTKWTAGAVKAEGDLLYPVEFWPDYSLGVNVGFVAENRGAKIDGSPIASPVAPGFYFGKPSLWTTWDKKPAFQFPSEYGAVREFNLMPWNYKSANGTPVPIRAMISENRFILQNPDNPKTFGLGALPFPDGAKAVQLTSNGTLFFNNGNFRHSTTNESLHNALGAAASFEQIIDISNQGSILFRKQDDSLAVALPFKFSDSVLPDGSIDYCSGLDDTQSPPWVMVPLVGTTKIHLQSAGGDSTPIALIPSGSGTDALPIISPPTATSLSQEITLTSFDILGDESDTQVVTPSVGTTNSTVEILKISKKKRRDVTLALHPIAHPTYGAPANVPTQQELEDFLDEIYGRQCNVWISVTVNPVTTIDWDVEKGEGYDEFPDGLFDSATNKFNQKLDIAASQPSTKEEAAFDSIHDSTKLINIFLIGGCKALTTNAIYLEINTNRQILARTSSSVRGFAGGGRRRIYLHDGSFDQISSPYLAPNNWVMAHEIGHIFGLYHSDDNVIADPNDPDHTRRVMLGAPTLFRPTTSQPCLLTKSEWDEIGSVIDSFE